MRCLHLFPNPQTRIIHQINNIRIHILKRGLSTKLISTKYSFAVILNNKFIAVILQWLYDTYSVFVTPSRHCIVLDSLHLVTALPALHANNAMYIMYIHNALYIHIMYIHIMHWDGPARPGRTKKRSAKFSAKNLPCHRSPHGGISDAETLSGFIRTIL